MACSGAIYYFVPAIVSIIIFWVLSPKSASLISGKGFPTMYLVLSNIFYGLRSRWVILWLCSSWTPRLIWKMHSRDSFSFILFPFIKLSASLYYSYNTTMNLQNNTLLCTTPPQADQLYRIFSKCFTSTPSSATHWSTSTYWYLRGQSDSFWPYEKQ